MVAAVVVGNHNVNNPSGGFTHCSRYEFARSRNMVAVVGGRTRTQPHVASTSGPKWSRDVEKMVVSRDRMLTPTPDFCASCPCRAAAASVWIRGSFSIPESCDLINGNAANPFPSRRGCSVPFLYYMPESR
jgi:hypothetical protein